MQACNDLNLLCMFPSCKHKSATKTTENDRIHDSSEHKMIPPIPSSMDATLFMIFLGLSCEHYRQYQLCRLRMLQDILISSEDQCRLLGALICPA